MENISELLYFFAILFINVLSMFACFAIAKNRGSDRGFWVGLAVFFGPLVIPFVLMAKKGNER